MKKIYIEPETVSVFLKSEKLLNKVSGDGLRMSISNDGATEEAGSRRSNNVWDDEEQSVAFNI